AAKACAWRFAAAASDTIEPTHAVCLPSIHRHECFRPTRPAGGRMSESNQPSLAHKLLKTIPGLLISAFFVWRTFFPHGHPAISRAQLHSLRLVEPAWIVPFVLFSVASYTMRSLRWKRMMRPAGTSFKTCARVFMTSLA